ncbi:hypothetical protein COY32_06285 [candidate division WWE3 bacterium CG_4_10_14_0_2_um_filter_41_14]|uniref:Uncharacterized protein n=1 Tax=candidate division WWE3 bacterium CG_4_10_14_0_2_um_filter_41_14 TaxID=1975072 RepID=A0A2M7TFC2_UNCKA|nr:MAG: hypothetical protein COY32_06285 [candidate division WWE3 bacterium CG_4_10_14_0_2_um_filter_41_14]
MSIKNAQKGVTLPRKGKPTMRNFGQYIKERLEAASLWAIVKVLALLLVVVISDIEFVIEFFESQVAVSLVFIFVMAAYTVAILAVVFVGTLIIASIPLLLSNKAAGLGDSWGLPRHRYHRREPGRGVSRSDGFYGC